MDLSRGLVASVVFGYGLALSTCTGAEEVLAYTPSAYGDATGQEAAADQVDPPAAEATEDTSTSSPPPVSGSPCCGQPKCDCAKTKALAKAAAGAYRGVFYNNDFSYLCDPCYNGCLLGESLKRLPIGCFTTIDFGGEYRARYHSEHNLRLKPLTGRNDDFLLHRTRLYLNAEVGERFRFYGEAIDATSWWQNHPPRAIEVNRFDALNLFGDLMLLKDIVRDGDKLWVRGGRQELLYGTERLISPLDWSNTRRTFDGVKMFYQSKTSITAAAAIPTRNVKLAI
jgi:hypothetical protein